MNELSIYIHWPFCRSKCPYCDFMSKQENESGIYDKTEKYLLLDLQNSVKEIDFVKIDTIFFGGGTPSLMSPKCVEKIVNFLDKNYEISNEVEITLEANPATFSMEKLQNFRSAGINRLSLGIQSFQDKNLRFLGRIYDSRQAMIAAELVSGHFANFSFDFMYGYEPQSIDDLENDLSIAMRFNCPHISCYQLTFEENTPFFQRLKRGEISEIDENIAITYSEFIERFLEGYSLHRYEISNYARKGAESKHNLAYWNYKDYLGIGPSAHSRIMINDQKYEMVKFKFIQEWKEHVRKNCSLYEIKHPLSKSEQLEEMLIMGLRLSSGVSLKNIEKTFPLELVNLLFQRICALREQGFVLYDNENLRLTSKGLLILDSVLEFIFG
ncbi:MAG: radical SAM family heme chaperone HemW [Alphaproteobacteria bacterium]|nr:radical SAM family heme chaperone HemW [Alphaproteobacteria bacterium]